jgi:hypothetical protein
VDLGRFSFQPPLRRTGGTAPCMHCRGSSTRECCTGEPI